MTPPSVVVVGAQKAGTTGVLRTLGTHPQLHALRNQECGILHHSATEWHSWLRRYEPRASRSSRPVVAKLATAMHFADTLSNIRALNGDVRLIVVLRHPVDRIVSLYNYARQSGLERRPFADAVVDDRVHSAEGRWRLVTYSGGSRYAEAIGHLGRLFPADQILYLDYDSVRDGSYLAATGTFLSLDASGFVPVIANESASPRSTVVARLTQAQGLRRAARAVVPAPSREAVRSTVRRLNSGSRRKGAEQGPSADLREVLLQRHRVDVRAAEGALGKELPSWRI